MSKLKPPGKGENVEICDHGASQDSGGNETSQSRSPCFLAQVLNFMYRAMRDERPAWNPRGSRNQLCLIGAWIEQRTPLQDLWARAAERAVSRQGPQNSCVQTLPEGAKKRTAGRGRPGRYLWVYAPISYFQEKRGSFGTIGEVGDAASCQPCRDCFGGSAGHTLQVQKSQNPCP